MKHAILYLIGCSKPLFNFLPYFLNGMRSVCHIYINLKSQADLYFDSAILDFESVNKTEKCENFRPTAIFT